jgi:hypothetical protein
MNVCIKVYGQVTSHWVKHCIIFPWCLFLHLYQSATNIDDLLSTLCDLELSAPSSL